MRMTHWRGVCLVRQKRHMMPTNGCGWNEPQPQNEGQTLFLPNSVYFNQMEVHFDKLMSTQAKI